MRMFTLVAVSLSLSLVACSTSYKDDPPASGSSASAQTPSTGTSSGGKGGSTAPTASGKEDDAGATGKPAADGTSGKPGADGTSGKPATDSDCLATCETTMVAKCGGDTTVCDDVCALTATEIACLEAAPTCDKSVWVSCLAGNDTDAGAGAGKGGGK